jgi:hypothetical protein
MMMSSARFTFLLIVVAAIAAGCSKQGGGVNGGNQPTSSFPAYSPSTVVTVGKYDDSAEVTNFGSNFFDNSGPDEYKPFMGVQELIKTSATLDDLNAWLQKLVQSPPQDLSATDNTAARESTSSPAPDSSSSPGPGVNQQFVDMLKVFGLVPSEFWSKDRGRVVMLIIMDPKRVADHLGPTLAVLDQYDKMPGFMRGGIDATVKKQTGISISDLMNTNTPMGMIVYAARTYKTEDTRVIILVDAQRQPNTLPTPHASGQ